MPKGKRGTQHSDAISHIFLETTRFRTAYARFVELIEYGWENNYCKALLVRGQSRVGKTQAITACIEKQLGSGWQLQQIPSILMVEAPANCSLRNFAANILTGLKAPDPDHGSEAAITRRIAANLKRHDIQLLIIDEVHRLIDSDTDKIKRGVSLWLTGLLNHRACPILLVGELGADRLFHKNMYLTGRSEGEVLLKPFDWSVEEDRFEFASVLHLIGKELGMAETSDLGDLRTAHLIWEFAGGLIGEAASLVSKARTIARRSNRPKITLDLLESAADELRIGDAARLKNPFRTARREGDD